MCEFFFQTTNIEILTISISSIAIIISLWSLKESKKANSISIHPMQLEIYDAFNGLKIQIYLHGIELDLLEVSKFYTFSQKSQFYFNKPFSNEIKRYFNICRELADLNRRYKRDTQQEKSTKQIEQRQDILSDEETSLSEIIEKNFNTILKI